ncbi:hypothetical protein DQ04_02071000 [Trypanosoma grayi]|uniref:hypothetical protein n=1 Tax=Trypanosoma grayi TaxID=71804 RepID=UPI0004F46607|nr:hypothetical protein DQ04_02071000 [Trypanosoma grayi]KEG12014.1 hypothetical protein DQ04_02071000 [Trypanosoma grayi]
MTVSTATAAAATATTAPPPAAEKAETAASGAKKPDSIPPKRGRKKSKEVTDTRVDAAPRATHASATSTKKTIVPPPAVVAEIPKEVCETMQEPTPLFAVDVLRIVGEWRTACADAPLEGADKTETQDENKGDVSSPPSLERSSVRGTTTTLGSAALGALLTRAVKLPEEFPELHHLLSMQLPQCRHPRNRVTVLHATDVVRNVDQLSVLVAFLCLYRASAFNSAPVYEGVVGELVRAIGLWREELDITSRTQQQQQQQHHEYAEMKKALMWLALELRRSHFEATAAVSRTNAAATKKKQKQKGKESERKEKTRGAALKGNTCDHKKWLEDTTQALLVEVAVSTANLIAHRASSSKLQSLSEGILDMAVVLLTTEMAGESQVHTKEADIWVKCISHLEIAVDAYLRQKAALEGAMCSVLDVRAHCIDLLDALRMLAIVDTAIPPQLRERTKHDVVDCFLKLCGGVGAQPAVFSDVLCSVEIAQRVRALPSRELCDAIEAAVFTGAALFCERADDNALEQLLQRINTESETSTHDGGNTEINENDERDGGLQELPPLSRRANVAFALFSVGFDPEAVLKSGLCVGHSALEVLELLQGAANFSRSFALAPLPARLAMSLTSESATLIEARIRAESRAGASPTELLEAPKSLREVLEENELTYKNRNGGSINSGGRKSGSVSLGMTLHLALATAIELLVRGEEKRMSTHLVRLLTLLEREGSYHYLVDGLSLLIDGFVERFRHAGRRQRLLQHHMPNNTSLEVERSLSEVTALFVPRVVETVQRQLARTRRDSVMNDAEQGAAMQLLQEVLHFTVYVITCGMNATTAKQLVGLHTMVVKSLGSGGPGNDIASLSDTVNRLNILVSHVGAKQRDLGLSRHPGSPGLRHCSTVLNDVVAAHLKPIAAAIQRGGSIETTRERYHVFSIVSLLFRLVSEYAVEVEPAELREFRTDVLDPALTRVLQQTNNGTSQRDEALDLAAISEITVVMCVPRTIHHLSRQLLDQLATAVEIATPKQLNQARTKEQKRQNSKIAARLLISVAAVCQLRQEKLTARYLTVVEALGPLLLPADVSAVLGAFVEFHVPADTEAVIALRSQLATEAGAPNSSLSVPETMLALQVLCELEDTNRLACAAILRRIVDSGYQLSPGEAGIVVRIATKLQLLGGALTDADLKFLGDLPTSLAETVLQVRQQCSPSDLPLVLQGFSQLNRERYGDLQDRVMKAYILRTIQLRQMLSPKEVVECLESYAAARVSHQYVFGVLLSRVADIKLKFSLPLIVRLVMCGVNATWDKSVQTACLTAAQPVFLGLVRHLLQSDPASLPSVASNAVVVLECLTEAFPNDPTSDLVLQNMASHHTALSLTTTLAVLRLIERKSSTEYNILRCMTEHAAAVLFPQTSPREFADLTRQFVQCGVRSRTLLSAVAKRFQEVKDNCDGGVLATLSEAFTIAHVDLEKAVITTLVERTVAISQSPDNTLPIPHCVTILKLFELLDLADVAHATTLLLDSVAATLEEDERCQTGVILRSPEDINVLISACLRVNLPQHLKLSRRCADELFKIIESERSGEGQQRPVGGGWQADLMLVVRLTSGVVQLGLADHPVVPHLFDTLYEKRSALMRRRLLMQTATEMIQTAGEEAHQQLYALLVEGKLVA